MRDIGLGAEEVEQVEPLLTFRNANGEIEGVKYNQLSAVFINALKEQQAQIERQKNELSLQQQQVQNQQTLIEQQQAALTKQGRELSSLKQLVCRSHARIAACQ